MSDADLNKLKVTELKEELKKRGIDTKGNKAQLIQKLKRALKDERNEGGADDSEGAGDVSLEGGDSSAVMDSSQYDSALESSQNESTLDTSLSKPEEKLIDEHHEVKISSHVTELPESSVLLINKDISVAELPESTESANPEQVVLTSLKLEASLEPDRVEQLTVLEPKAEPALTHELTDIQPEAEERMMEEQTPEEQLTVEPAAESISVVKSIVEQISEDACKTEETIETEVEGRPQLEAKKEQRVAETAEPEKQTNDVETEGMKEKPVELTEKKEDVELLSVEESSVVLVEDSKTSEIEAEEKPDVDMEIIESLDSVKEDRRGEKRRRSRTRSRSHSADRHRACRSRSKSPKRGRHSRSRSRSKTHSRSRSRDRSPSRERRHYRSRSRSQERQQQNQSRSPDRGVVELPENEDWITSNVVQVDRYNCDLSVVVDEGGLKVTPLTYDGFAYMWHGIKSTYGVNKGRAGYEVKILEQLSVDHLPPEEESKHVVRVGFSVDAASTQLGEEKLSYGYGGTGKASTDCKFTNYGTTFGTGDVIGAYLDFESDPVVISYTKNGEDLGTCFEIPTDSLEGCALFPHVLTKNCSFECNFGQLEESFFPVKEGFTFLNLVPEEDRVRSTLPPAKKEDCEMIMMCGLPGSGKTCWAAKHSEGNPDKRYNILGTNSIIDKMKVMGLPRKRNYAGRWDVLIDLSTKCLNRLLTVAARKKRNYILDQTNVYPSAQRRKMRPFEGFQRTAVVIVPTDEEFKRRCEQREKEEGKEVPDSAVLEMKANFQLPTDGFIFDKVQFIELQKDEAQELVDQYNREGKQSSSGGRQYRGNDRNQSYDSRSNKSYGSYGGGQDRGRDNQRSWGYNNRRGGGGGGGSGGGYYNRDNKDSGGFGNRRGGGRDGGYSGSGGYSGGGGGGGYGGGYGGGGGGGYRRNDRGSSGSGYNQPDRRRDQSSWSSGGGYRDKRDNRGGSSGGRESSWGSNRSSGYPQQQQHSSWKSQGSQGGNRSTYGQSQQGSWGGQATSGQTGSWAATNAATSGWGGQQDWSQQAGYQQPTWGQWTPYSQQPQQQQQQVQQQPQQQQQATAAWNQQYWNSWNAYSQAQPGGWDYSQYNAQGGAQK